MLTEINYGSWVVKMKVFMHAQEVWAVVEDNELIDKHKDQMVLAAIFHAVPDMHLLQGILSFFDGLFFGQDHRHVSF